MAVVKHGKEIETKADLQNLITGLIFRKEDSFTLGDMVNLVAKYSKGTKLILTENQSKKLLNGVFDEVYELSDGLYRVYAVDKFWGVGEVENKKLKMKSYVRDL